MSIEIFLSIVGLVFVIASGVVASWVSARVDSARLSERIDSLESKLKAHEASTMNRDAETQKALKELLEMVHEIKILLAEKGIK